VYSGVSGAYKGKINRKKRVENDVAKGGTDLEKPILQDE